MGKTPLLERAETAIQFVNEAGGVFGVGLVEDLIAEIERLKMFYAYSSSSLDRVMTKITEQAYELKDGDMQSLQDIKMSLYAKAHDIDVNHELLEE